jgi:hypothetical protein
MSTASVKHLTNNEVLFVAQKSAIWTGPNSWGWADGYRLNLQESIAKPIFG